MSGVPALQVKGEAEAFAIEAKARAEAEQMAKKADAWKDYQDAAMVDMVLETLPKVKTLVPPLPGSFSFLFSESSPHFLSLLVFQLHFFQIFTPLFIFVSFG